MVISCHRTRETLASGHFMSVINILMQLRKVCNHPNLFDPRPIHSPFITSGICYTVPSLVLHALQRHPLEAGTGPGGVGTNVVVYRVPEFWGLQWSLCLCLPSI